MAKVSSRLLSRIRILVRIAATVLALAFLGASLAPLPSAAQTYQQSTDPQGAVSEQQLLNKLKPGGAISGQVSIPDKKSANLIHPAGRDWRTFRTVWLKWIGGVAVLGMIVLLIGFYMWRGTMKIAGGRSGRTIVRFTGFERFVHWLTATTFIVLGITGLNITFGRALILPWLGPEAFSAWSEWSKYAHNFISFAFTLGVLLMFLMWIGQNFPTKADMTWFKMGGGMFSKGHSEPAPAWKFNGGQKLLYWFIVLGGAAMIITGFILLFPFYAGLQIDSMELAQVFHGTVGVLFVSLIIAHIYLGTLGMEGAFESMSDGTVDVNWAKEHHPLWYDEVKNGAVDRDAVVTPAE
jgi:formate dehydrogenase subunit gamma